ncbi:hypothetical protein MMC22_003727 [Lobaria immixta]|nr:hypothetical protein [Lobaria immixta]
MSPAPILILHIASLVFSNGTVALGFTPNYTLPPDHTNYVSGSNVRSTLSILWNCLSIIILCTWNILHLNVPARRPTASSAVQKTWGMICDSSKKAKWMILSILMPELLLGKALDEFLSARHSCNKSLAKFAIDDGTEWGLTHSYFANMGGFVLDFTEILDQLFPWTNPDSASALFRLDEVASECNRYEMINLQRMRHKLWALTSIQILEARKLGLIQNLPQVSGRSLEAFSKGDTLVKILALVQVSWLIIQLIVRKIARLPSSQLEIAALAFSASSILTYLLYWNRPQGVETIWRMKVSRLPTKNELVSLIGAGPWHLWVQSRSESGIDGNYDLVPLPNDVFCSDGYFFLGAIIGGTVFGGLHCFAWNFHFPTPVEALVWRICSILTTVVPLASIPILSGLQLLFKFASGLANNVRWVRNLVGKDLNIANPFDGNVVLFIICVPARLFLMFEIFRTLCFLPPEVFIDTWSGNFPHWG